MPDRSREEAERMDGEWHRYIGWLLEDDHEFQMGDQARCHIEYRAFTNGYKAALSRARAAAVSELKKFGQHGYECPWNKCRTCRMIIGSECVSKGHRLAKCRCGFEDALRTLSQQEDGK